MPAPAGWVDSVSVRCRIPVVPSASCNSAARFAILSATSFKPWWLYVSVCLDFDTKDAEASVFRFRHGICQVFYEVEFMVERHGVRFVPVYTDHV
jgi:hypothetical protein